MRRFSNLMTTVAVGAAAASAVIWVSLGGTSAQAPEQATVMETPWGEPDLQGIWTDETNTPLQRAPRFANQEFFTEEQRAELDKAAIRAPGPRQTRGARHRARRRRRLQRGVPVRQAHRRAHVDDRRSAQWPDSADDAGGAEEHGRRSRVPSGALAIDGDVQERVESPAAGGKYDPKPSPRRAELPPRYNTAAHESLRQSGGRLVAGSLPDARSARVRRERRQLPPHRADAGRHLDLLRRGPRPGLAAQHRHGWRSASARRHPPVVRRLARPLGGQHARRRRDELQPEDRLSGLAREPAPGRALDAHRTRTRSNTRSRSKIRPCGRSPGPSSRNSRCRTARRTGSTTSRAATKGITVCRD